MLEGAKQRATRVLDSSTMRIECHAHRTPGTNPTPSHPGKCQRSIAKIGWLSTSIVHDLRNPLGTVFAGAEMLMELDPASPHFKRLAANIYRAAGRMRALLADLADVSRGDTETPEICKIRDIVTAGVEAALTAAEAQSVQILNDVPSCIEISLERSRMERVFFNLMANALEAMPRGGKVRITTGKAENCVLIVVEDTGPGIPLGIRDRLFEPFVTADKDHGLGLGLALSRQAVLDQGGDMWTEPAAGARFVVRLPLPEKAGIKGG
jgi:signal transduction histidine kinase